MAGVIGYGLPYRGIISTVYQFNKAKELGIFRYGGGLSADFGTSNFGVVVIFPADSYIIQLILGSTRISKRISFDGGVNWSEWAD